MFPGSTLARFGLSPVAIAHEVVVAHHAGETQLLKLRICAQAVKEWVFVHGGIGAVVALDGDLEHL